MKREVSEEVLQKGTATLGRSVKERGVFWNWLPQCSERGRQEY